MASLTLPSKSDLVQFYQGQNVADVPKPAAVLDRAIVRRHCARMKQTVKALNIGFRAHVKTHKTTEIAAMQLDQDSPEANFIASTPTEIEMLVPLLKQAQTTHSTVNVLYGVPLVPSSIDRLARLALSLGPNAQKSLSVMIDHPDQLPLLSKFSAQTGFPLCVFVKVDTGYHRAGLPPLALNKQGLLEKLAAAERKGDAYLLGLYSHSSSSYAATSAEEAMAYLIREIRECRSAWGHWRALFPRDRKLVISVGATPQVASSDTLVSELSSSSTSTSTTAASSKEAQELVALLRNDGGGGGGGGGGEEEEEEESKTTRIELHAGNYAVLDMQQLHTHARRAADVDCPQKEVALSVVAEVCSVYNGPGEREKPEALVAAGTLALGREPCGAYPGWGVVVVAAAAAAAAAGQQEGGEKGRKLIVERISQEHGIVSWWSGDDGKETRGEEDNIIPLEVGMAVRIYPNHACITASFYNWFFVVDSDEDPTASKIVDVWVRARAEGMDALAATRLQ